MKSDPWQVAQVAGASSVDRGVAGWIPDQDMYTGCGFNPQSGHMREGGQLISVCLSVCLPAPLSLNAMKIVLG